MTPGYRSIREAAKELGACEDTVRAWIKRKVLKAFQPFPGAKIRIRVEDLESFKRASDTTKA